MGGATYTPKQRNWHWYSDALAEPTATQSLANENTKPTLADNTSILRLRVTIAETGGKADNSVTISMQYDTQSNFATVQSFGAAAHWNYAAGAGTEGSAVTTQLLTDATTKNEYCESGTNVVAIDASTTNELDIAIVPMANVSGNTTYYFRVVGDGTAIALDTGETSPQVLTAVKTYSLAVQSGSLALTGTAAGLKAARKLSIGSGSLALSGTATALRAARKLAVASGSLSLTGTAIAMKAARKLAIGNGALSLIGTHVDLSQGTSLTHYTLAIGNGALSLLGTAAALRVARKLGLATGTVNLSGTAAALKATRKISLGSGPLTLAGISVSLKTTRKLSLATGIFALAGDSLSFPITRRLNIQPGEFRLHGKSVKYIYQALPPPTKAHSGRGKKNYAKHLSRPQ